MLFCLFVFTSLDILMSKEWLIKIIHGKILLLLISAKVVGSAVLSLVERIKLAHIKVPIVVEVALVH